MIDSILSIKEDILESLGQTFYMVSISLVLSVVLGLIFGLLLYVTSSNLFCANRIVNKIVGTLLNIIQSIPFLILMILLLPLSKLIVGTKIGSKAVLVPLTIASTAFFARLEEMSLSEVDKGIVEAFISTGASKLKVLFKIVLPESLSSLVKNITVNAISILGFSAMAGLVGGGGLGDLAYRYGYQRYRTEIMLVCVILLIILVQIIQVQGSRIANKIEKK